MKITSVVQELSTELSRYRSITNLGYWVTKTRELRKTQKKHNKKGLRLGCPKKNKAVSVQQQYGWNRVVPAVAAVKQRSM